MNFKDLNTKRVYRSGEDSILNDFYTPSLTASVRYDRAVGFFSTSILMYALAGIRSLIKNNGEMRLVIGYPLDDEEFEVLKDGGLVSHLAKKLERDLESLIAEAVTDVLKYRLKLFFLMTVTGRLKIKFAYRRRGMYHEKVGIMYDAHGNKILFQGSANETTNAINSDLNFESISVYRSWETEVYAGYAKPYEEGFERLWLGEDPHVAVFDIPSELYTAIHKKVTENNLSMHTIDLNEDENKLEEHGFDIYNKGYPVEPVKINGSEFKVLSHQKKALRSWADNNYQGIFKLATGAGKTITAMVGVSKIFEANRSKKLALIVAVPYVALAEQWVKELKIFNMTPIQCFGNKNVWEEKLRSAINQLNLKAIDFFSVVVVNQTLKSENFQSSISRIATSDIFFVGDECHHHSSEALSNAVPEAQYKIGLSATPYSDELDVGYETDPIKIENLKKAYGEIVATYTMANALGQGVLTPYNYYLNIVQLSEAEMDSFLELSREIARLYALESTEMSNKLKDIIRRRNKIISNASNKISVLRDLLRELDLEDKQHTLIYVGEGSVLDQGDGDGRSKDIAQLQAVSETMKTLGWKISRFTAEENRAERLAIMDDFKEGSIDALVSMKVLDEGIDIPACKRAFILASTTNSRQFVQRRGRILRKSPGKEVADIYDFVVVPSPQGKGESCFSGLVRRELYRVMEFVRLSKNRAQVEPIACELAETFDLDIKEF
ncbi:DEAD/DEAH box helicase family protein [Pseudomonas sp. PAMC 26793]|uniref:DEAD/DEAH box helicase family protein n=1 Tax=Pseudomonas sp. PAMC 26793 TaxID=1240676 RepID=UPI00030993A5|nr:DEAD/DEAH box helicase family protein [Pseudomonas sp. PAMC 26793]